MYHICKRCKSYSNSQEHSRNTVIANFAHSHPQTSETHVGYEKKTR